jgi:hypothetical protein
MAAIIEDFMGWSKKKPGSFQDPSTRYTLIGVGNLCVWRGDKTS